MMPIPRWRVLLIGAGAVGTVQAGMLAYLRQQSIIAGATEPVPIVHWIVRNPNTRRMLGKDGFNFQTFSGENSLLPQVNLQNMLISDSLESLVDLQFDLVIIAVKSFQVAGVLSAVKQQINHRAVLILCNGWHPVKDCFWGLVFGGSYIAGSSVHHSSNYSISVGSLFKEVAVDRKLIGLMHNEVVRYSISSDFAQQALIKLAINCVVNPIASLMLVRNGQLSTPPIVILLETVISEVENIFAQIDVPGVKDLKISDEIMQVLVHSGANYCSMYQDFANGRQSELSDIMTPMISWGKTARVETTNLEWIKLTLDAAQIASGLNISTVKSY